jgi:hypothetical protein
MKLKVKDRVKVSAAFWNKYPNTYNELRGLVGTITYVSSIASIISVGFTIDGVYYTYGFGRERDLRKI